MMRLKLFSPETFCLCVLFCCFSCAETYDLYNESDFLDSQTLRKAKQEYDVLFRGLSDYDSLYANPQWDSYRKLVDGTDVVSYYVFLKNDVRRYKSHLIINRKDGDVSYFIFNLPSAYENIESYMSQKIPKAVEFARDKDLQGWYLADTTNVKVATRTLPYDNLYFIPDDGGGGGDEPWGWNTNVNPFDIPEVVVTAPKPAEKSDSNTSADTDYTPPAGLDNVLGVGGGSSPSGSSSGSPNKDNSIEGGSTGDVDPCEAAKKLSRDAAIMARISELFSDVLNYRVGVTEYGWVKTAKGNILRPTIRKEGSMSYSSALGGGKITERYHTHPGGGAPFPSWEDLVALSTDYKNGRIDVDDFSYGVISIYGCFSIVVTSENAFEGFANKVYKEDAIFKERFYEMVQKSNTNLDTCIGKYIKFLTSSSSGLEVLFCPAEIGDNDSVTWGNWKAKTSNAVSDLLDNDCGVNQ